MSRRPIFPVIWSSLWLLLAILDVVLPPSSHGAWWATYYAFLAAIALRRAYDRSDRGPRERAVWLSAGVVFLVAIAFAIGRVGP